SDGAPRNAEEEILAEIWADVLGRSRVGVNESFFELGGHSLLATHLIARVREALRADLHLRDLFSAPTVAGLARCVAELRGSAPMGEPAPPAAEPDPEGRFLPFPLTHLQQAFWVGRNAAVELGNVASHRYLEIEGDLDLDRFELAWQLLI